MDSERKKRRILDYLNDGEELGIEGPAVTPRTSSAAAVVAARSLLPRFRWARLARLGRKGTGAGAGAGKEKGKGKGKEEEIAVEKAEHKPLVASVRGADSDVTRPSDLGVGVSLVFLLAKTSDEFNKMVKVRAEMETLLKEIKDQVRNSSDGVDDASKPLNLDSTAASSSCLTDGNDRVANVHSEDHATSSGVEVVRSCEKSSSEDVCCVEVDVLEEEFHAELERLQVNYGSDTPPFLPEEHDSEPLDDIAEYRPGFDDDSGKIVEEEDDDDDHDAEYNGVSAVELERRLHELLHQRNQERIEELEAALRCAEKKLVEKEMESCLWKDKAKLALHEDNELQ